MVETHPSPEVVQAFLQGRLDGAEARTVESHLEQCDSCCALLARQNDNTLVELVRQAVTQDGETAALGEAVEPAQCPPELRDHPRYQVSSLIGRGGMGAVYKAEHRLMQRIVALKIVHPSLVAHPTAVQRFRREVRVAAKLSHPHIVAAFDADQAGDVHFLVMEFVDGVSLDRWIADSPRPSIPQACLWIRQAALALQHAHEQGMAHRDIKPHNLMVSREGAIKILDFGLTRLVSESAGGETSGTPAATTRDGALLGTPDYIAPEQITNAGAADIRSDIYSLGCTFYHLLVGRPPYAGRTILEKLHAHGSAELPRADAIRPETPPELLAVLARMTAKNPADRYQTPKEVAEALVPFIKGRGARTTARSAGTEPPREAVKPASPAKAAAPAKREMAPAARTAEAPTDPVARPAVAPKVVSVPAPPAPEPLPDLLSIPSTPYTIVTVANDPWRGGAGRATWLTRLDLRTRAALAIGALVFGGALAAWVYLSGGGGRGAIGGGGGGARGGAPVATLPEAPDGGAREGAARGIEVSGGDTPTGGNSGSASDPSGDSPRPDAASRRLLLVLPSRGLWFPDYSRVADAIAEIRRQGAPVSMIAAGITTAPARLLPESPVGEARPDVKLGPDVKAADYDALLFIGFDTTEFTPGGEAEGEVRRVIGEFQSQGKVIASLCAGQRVLAAHGLLRGKNVALCPQVPAREIQAAGGATIEQFVVRDGKLVTGSRDADAAELLRVIEQAR